MLKQETDIVVVDVPLLFEARMQKMFDKIIVVYARKEDQLQRLRKKGMSTKEALLRISSQLPIQKKLANAHYIIDNRGTKDFLKKQAAIIYKNLSKCL